MFRKHSYPAFFCILAGLALTACDLEAPSFEPDEDTCTTRENGNMRGSDGAICTDGFWVAPSENPDAGNPDTASPNACGGTAQLPHEPGDACGACGLDEYICDGTDNVTCDEQIGCPPNRITIETTTDIDGEKAVLHATITAVDSDNLPINHGFCWSIKDELGDTLDEQCEPLGALQKSDEGKKIELEIIGLWPGHRYFAQAYLETADKPGEKQRSPNDEFLSFAPAPHLLSASSDQTGYVTLNWEAAKADGALPAASGPVDATPPPNL